LNGNFATNFDNWTAGANWSVVGGKASCTAGAGTLAQTVTTFVNGCNYQVSFIITKTAGSSIDVTGGNTTVAGLTAGTWTFLWHAHSTGALTFTPQADFVGTVDVVVSQQRTSSVYTDLGTGSVFHTAIGLTTDSLLWKQNPTLSGLARDIASSIIEEDGTIHTLWLFDDANNHFETTEEFNFHDIIADSINVRSITATNNVAGNDLIATDSLMGVTGNFTGLLTGTSSTMTNNVTGNDIIAVDSIMGVTGNFTGKIQGLNVTATNNLTTNDLTVADTTALNGVTTTGALVTPLNGGMVPVFDRSVTAAATIGTEQGVIFRVDVADVLSVGGVSNGAGALSSRFVRLEGGLWGNVRTTAINATANLNDWQIVATDTVTITLPALSTCYTVDGFGFLLNIYADRNTVCTINAAGTDSINGGVTVVIDDWEGITLQAMDAVRWGVQ
jgi:hypothetical protein